MINYKLIKNALTGQVNTVNKIEDEKIFCIPFAPDNVDYQAYLKWVSEGNIAEQAD